MAQIWPEVARRLLRKSHQQGDSRKVASIADDLRGQNIDLDDDLAALVLRAERPTDADPRRDRRYPAAQWPRP